MCSESRQAKKKGGPEDPPPMRNRLEVETKRELQFAVVAVLARHLHEGRQVGWIRSDSVPVGVIESIVGLGAELEADRLFDREILEQPDVVILEARVV